MASGGCPLDERDRHAQRYIPADSWLGRSFGVRWVLCDNALTIEEVWE